VGSCIAWLSKRLISGAALTAQIRPYRQTLARLQQAPTPARAGKQVRRGDLSRRRTVNPVEMRTFGDFRVSCRSGWFCPAFVTAGFTDGAAGVQDDLF
jgi:hypothetical protein